MDWSARDMKPITHASIAIRRAKGARGGDDGGGRGHQDDSETSGRGGGPSRHVNGVRDEYGGHAGGDAPRPNRKKESGSGWRYSSGGHSGWDQAYEPMDWSARDMKPVANASIAIRRARGIGEAGDGKAYRGRSEGAGGQRSGRPSATSRSAALKPGTNETTLPPIDRANARKQQEHSQSSPATAREHGPVRRRLASPEEHELHEAWNERGRDAEG